jgi:arylsulfatase A-like enzyme
MSPNISRFCISTKHASWQGLVLILLIGLTAGRSLAEEPPSFLVIVADDLGWADVGYHGSPIPTPNIDRLCAEGVELDRHYVAPMCTPTRAALLTGRYWSRFGNTKPSNTRVLPWETETLASALRRVGYDTCITGKWHLGSKPEWGPRKFGFNHSHGSLAGGVGPWNHLYKHGPYSRTWHRSDTLIEEAGHVTDLVARQAIEYVKAKRDGPFFVYVPFTAVHSPFDEPDEWLDQGKQAEPQRPQYAASTMHMDHAVGQMVHCLERSGRRENTLILFFSDNGGMVTAADGDSQRYPGDYPRGQPGGSNLPLRGRKTQAYEGGIRTPAFVNWPGRLTPRKVTAPLHVVDWMPTLCRLAGCEPAGDLGWDGRDVWPVLSGDSAGDPQRVLYCKSPNANMIAVHRGPWKIVHFPKTQATELYHLGDDPNETADLASSKPEVVSELLALMEREAKRDDTAVPDPLRPGPALEVESR